MEYVTYFLLIILYTIGTVTVCGLLVAICEWLFQRFMGDGVGYKAVIATSVIGTPVHEFGHLVMCLIFGHKVKKVCFLNLRSKNGTLGYVKHSYNNRNIYHRIGNLFIGIGPIFSGLGIITLMLFLAFPEALDSYFGNAEYIISSGGNIFQILSEGLKIIPALFSDSESALWLRIIAIVVMLSVSLHVTLSPADIKGSASALPFYFIAVFLFGGITSLMGLEVMANITDALALFNAYLVAMFTLVIVFSLMLVLIALVIFMIRQIFGAVFGRRA